MEETSRKKKITTIILMLMIVVAAVAVGLAVHYHHEAGKGFLVRGNQVYALDGNLERNGSAIIIPNRVGFRKVEEVTLVKSRKTALRFISFDVLEIPGLRKLTLKNYPVANLDLRQNRQITALHLTRTNIETLDLSEQSLLRTLCLIRNRRLSSLDLRHNPRLRQLDLSGTHIRKLDLSSNPELVRLNLSGTRLTHLDLSKNSKLQDVDLTGTGIQRIDIRANKALKKIQLGEFVTIKGKTKGIRVIRK